MSPNKLTPDEETLPHTTSVTVSTETGSELERISPAATVRSANDSNDYENKRSIEPVIKKKKKSKDSKLKLNGSKVTKVSHQSNSSSNGKRESRLDSSVKIVPVNDDHIFNKSSLGKCVTTCKPLEITNFRKSSEEAKFFKMRPVTNTNITTISPLNSNALDPVSKQTLKSKKRRSEESIDKRTHDEYEFPDSPNPISSKKVKRMNSENSRKKSSDKISSVNTTSISKKLSTSSKNKVNNSGNVALAKLNMNEKSDAVLKQTSSRSIVAASDTRKTKQEESKVISQKSSIPKKQLTSTSEQRIIIDSSKKSSLAIQEIKTSQPSGITISNISAPSINNSPAIITIDSKKPITSSATFNSHSQVNVLSVPTNSSSLVVQNAALITNSTNTVATIVPISNNALNATVTIVSPTTLTTIPSTPIKSIPAQQQSNNNNQSGTPNTSRRRSQDKKALTVREGLMRTGDFVVALEESNASLPMIWRIEGKSLLQRFEPSEQDGAVVYTNTSSVRISLLTIIGN